MLTKQSLMSESPIVDLRLRTGQFRIRWMFFLVTFCALGISAFCWLPFGWALIANQAGMLAIALFVGKRSPVLRKILLALVVSVGAVWLRGPSVVKDGWGIGTAFSAAGLIVFVALSAVEAFERYRRTGQFSNL